MNGLLDYCGRDTRPLCPSMLAIREANHRAARAKGYAADDMPLPAPRPKRPKIWTRLKEVPEDDRPPHPLAGRTHAEVAAAMAIRRAGVLRLIGQGCVTIPEIAAELGEDRRHVAVFMRRMARRGLIRRNGHKPRPHNANGWVMATCWAVCTEDAPALEPGKSTERKTP